MDKKSFLQFLLISSLIIVGWYAATWLLGGLAPQRPEQPPPAAGAQQGEPEAISGEPPQTGETPTIRQADPGQQVPPPAAANEVHGLVLQNERIRASWTNRGAALEALILRRYRAPYFEADGSERPALTLVQDFQEGYYSDLVEIVTFLAPPDDPKTWREDVPTADVLYEAHVGEDQIVFEGALDPRLSARKTVSLSPGQNHYEVALEFINRTDVPLRFTYRLRGPAGVERETLNTHYLATVVGYAERGKCQVTQVSARKLRGGNRINESANILWAGLVSQYFVAFVEPARSDWIQAVESKLVVETDIAEARGRWQKGALAPRSEPKRADLARGNATTVILSTEVDLPPGETVTHTYRLVAAPILEEVLDPYGKGITKALRAGSVPKITWVLSLGTIGWISPLLLGILDLFYGIVRNYGVAILMLTVLVRGVLHPLTRKSQVSMRKMQILQPKLMELQKKYKNDRQKLVQEQMTLYRRYGAHPMSGCWPVFLQMPVFIALFITLRASVQLRQAAFIPGWISDLSQPDTVWHFPFYLPILGNELNILPFLMVAAWMLNQHFMPKPADARAQQQQKIMKWMPLLFAVMLYGFASGLLLYWTMSSAVGTLEHWLIRRQTAHLQLEPAEREPKRKRGAKGGSEPAKGGLLNRVMQRIEDQQKRSEQARSSRPHKRG